MKRAFAFLKKELMLTVSVLAAIAALIITPPTTALLGAIDWRTLGTLLMMLIVLEGFKQENVLRPLIALAKNLRRMTLLSLCDELWVFGDRISKGMAAEIEYAKSACIPIRYFDLVPREVKAE